MKRHFNVTVYIINPDDKKFLFINHKKLNKWLPPGGHVDENERPDDAALREVLEETGIKVILEGERFPRMIDIVRPAGIQLNVIEAGEHEHMDLIYLATPLKNQTETLNEKETTGIQWFSIDKIENATFNTFPETKKWCRKFYNQNY